MKFRLVACLMLVAAQPAAAADQNSADWRTGLDRLAAELKSVHPRPFAKVGELTFQRELDSLKQRLPRLSEEQRVVEAMRLVASLGDGHTQVEPTGAEWRSWYPVRIVDFGDGYFVTSAHRSVADLAGAELLQIGGRPAAEAVEAARTLMGADNAFDRKIRMFALHNSRLMRGLGFADPSGALRIKARLRNGRVVDRMLISAPQTEQRFVSADNLFEWNFQAEVYGLGMGGDADWVAAFGPTPSSGFREPDPARPLFLAERSRYFRRSLPESGAYYIQINQVDDTSLIDFMKESMAEVDRLRPKHLIVDLRNNFGGDASRAREIVHQFIQREAKTWGELYVLTSGKTFSAAINLLDELADNVEMTLIGEPPGAAFNAYGDPVVRLIPDAGLRLEVSSVIHQLSDSNDHRAFVPVDVPAPMPFSDYVRGKDPAVDPILAGEEMRSIPQIIRTEGGAAARIAFRDRERRFAGLPWWQPPTELELRRACDYLVGAKRLDQALEACKLTSEIHPYVWNSWYNLGATQRAAGLMSERLSSYSCVLALEPNNWNGPALRRAIAAATEPVPLPPGCPVRRR